LVLRRLNANVPKDQLSTLNKSVYYSVMEGKKKHGNLIFHDGSWQFIRLSDAQDAHLLKDLHKDPELRDFSLNTEDNLVSLKNIAPNFDFQYFAGNPVMHSPFARRLNEDIRPRKTKLKPRKNKKQIRPSSKEPLTSELHPKQVNEAEHNQTVNGDRSKNY
jgi:hypothetical protein